MDNSLRYLCLLYLIKFAFVIQPWANEKMICLPIHGRHHISFYQWNNESYRIIVIQLTMWNEDSNPIKKEHKSCRSDRFVKFPFLFTPNFPEYFFFFLQNFEIFLNFWEVNALVLYIVGVCWLFFAPRSKQIFQLWSTWTKWGVWNMTWMSVECRFCFSKIIEVFSTLFHLLVTLKITNNITLPYNLYFEEILQLLKKKIENSFPPLF